MKVRDLPKHCRPREKLFEKGPESLKDYELLAILLRTGYKGKSALDVARRILRQYPLGNLLNLLPQNLARTKGVGKSRASIILAANELILRAGSGKKDLAIVKPSDIVKAVSFLETKKKEYLVAIYLNARKNIIDTKTISIGTVDTSLVHPREVFAPGMVAGAVSVALAHNHTSGDPAPSVDDIAITKRLAKAGALLGVHLIDHVIIGNKTFVSLKEKGVI